MAKKHLESPDQGLPIELKRSAPRAVTLTLAGRAAVVCVIALLAGAPFAGAWLYSRSAGRTVSEVGTTEAHVTEISRPRGENPRVRVSYRYTVEGREYSGRTKLKKGEDNRFAVGSSVPVEYEPSKPNKNWIRGYRPRPIPRWVIAAVPGSMVLWAVPIVAALRRQKRLLALGRPALARVTESRRLRITRAGTGIIRYGWCGSSAWARIPRRCCTSRFSHNRRGTFQARSPQPFRGRNPTVSVCNRLL
jgi:hypothetical protein